MKRISSRSREVAELIRDRVSFNTHGALKARSVQGLSAWDSGELSGEDYEQFRADCDRIRYVVYSYATPIAWWVRTPDERWHRVSQRFSRTTSAHQGKLYLIP